MLDSAGILLVVVIVILTILLLVLGVQTFLILKDFRKTLNKTNNLLDDVKMGSNVAKIIGSLGTVLLGGKNIIDLISSQKENKKTEDKKDIKLIAKKEVSPGKTIRRFFKRRPH
ncbi:MAG: hypothetical protein AAB931_00600 [Patescibacteria group bacterium]